MQTKRAGKKIFVGLESSGKSLLMAKEIVWNINRNAYWAKKTAKYNQEKRPIITNLPLSQKLLDYAESKGVEIYKWTDISEFPKLTECDLYIDEIGTYFDSRQYADLPLSIRKWLPQAEKVGVQIIGTTQDFGQVDKSFRRLCKEVFEIKKIIGSERPMATAPRVRFIWGYLGAWKLDPASFDGEQVEMKSISMFPNFIRIRKKDTLWYDTSARVLDTPPPPLQHITRTCPDCDFIKTIHR